MLGFGDEVNVIVLNRTFDDPEAAVRGRGNGPADNRKDAA